MRPTVALLAAVAVLTACGDNGQQERQLSLLRADLDAQVEAQQSLQGRIAELEDALAAATTDEGTEQALGEFTERIDALQSTLDQLAAQLEEEAQARAQGDANAEAAASDLAGQVAGLREDVNSLDARLAQLRGEFDTLRDLFDQHRSDH